MAYYVDDTGTLFTFEISSLNTITLSNGAVLPDPPPNGQMFATGKAARFYAALVILYKDPAKALAEHTETVKKVAEVWDIFQGEVDS